MTNIWFLSVTVSSLEENYSFPNQMMSHDATEKPCYVHSPHRGISITECECMPLEADQLFVQAHFYSQYQPLKIKQPLAFVHKRVCE